MFQNYLITALRNFTRHKLYSFINIAGLTVGLTCAIFIILFVRDQLSYDRWIPGTENLYRVEMTVSLPGRPPELTAHTPFIVPQTMLEQIPEVTARTRLMPHSITVRVGNRQFPETIDAVDPNFLEVIKLPLVAGNPVTVFAQPESVVLSQTEARKYFGGGPALGKAITVSAEYCAATGENCQERQQLLTVTGILRDLPHNTQLAIDLLVSNTSKADPMSQGAKTEWGVFNGWGYVRLAPGTDPGRVVAKLRTIFDRLIDPQMFGANLRGGDALRPRLTPFRDAHLSTDRYASLGGSSMTPAGSWITVYGFLAVGVLILLMACFNFTNLATARAMVRAREISLRKVVGALRGQIAIQFLGESVLTAMIALVLALALTEMLLPSFDRLLNTPIQFDYVRDWPPLLLVSCIGIAVGLASGFYPALVLSRIRPAGILRNNAGLTGSGVLRTILVVLQFATSIGLGIAVLVVFAQISFGRQMDLGFRQNGILLIDGRNLLPKTRESYVQALRSAPGVLGSATSDDAALPFVSHENNAHVQWPGGPAGVEFRNVNIGPNFLRVYGVHLLAGRALSEKYSGDIAGKPQDIAPFNILINETAARRMGYAAQNAVGKTITVYMSPATIVGLVADTKIHGVSEIIPPTIYWDHPAWTDQISVRVAGPHLPATLAFIDRTWHRFAPRTAIERHFLDEDFEKQFLADEQQGTMFGIFVGIAIFIACLGLFGLAAISTERRTKEIGLRKTFGARTRDIIWMLLWQFSIPVLIANLIAWPVAYYYLHDWLEGYAYRISLSPLYFVGAGAVALLIAWATVIVHAAHVARANPVHALRYE